MGETGMTIQTKYEYITIEEILQSKLRKTHVWEVRNKKSRHLLGVIQWQAPWRQYIFAPEPRIIFSAGCLHDIRAFIYQQMEARK